MKTMKKMISLIVVLMLSMSLAVPSFAADGTTYSLTINGTTGHTYEVYQIFTGDLATEGEDKILSNIKWGSGVTGEGQTALGNAAEKAESLTDTAAAAAFADVLVAGAGEGEEKVAYLANAANPVKADENGKFILDGLAPGYYLVKDKDGSLKDKDGDAYTKFILKVVGPVEVATKSSETTSEKKVKDTNDSVAESTTEWQDSADYDIGDNVPFQLKAMLGANVEEYSTYKVVFHDTLSAGLTYNGDAVVKIDGKVVTESFTITHDNGTLTISCADVKAIGATNNSVITVEYTAKLNEKAVVGSAGNTNTMYVEYSNNPNSGHEGETGTTPEDTVIVFTYKVVVNKVDENQKALAGAEFKLEKKIGETWTVIDRLTVEQGTKFTFTGLDDGKYRLTETKTPAGYNTIEPIEFEITATHNGLVLDGLSGTVIEFTSNVAEGSLTSDIVNQKGVTLPETGGMGTTLFYIVGGVLIVGAFVAFVTKKRMER